ncbi:hypothetical protein BS47DRAFT_1347563 [Hydnum rufescens UP504]|uniref:Uncharacterized protein n=1 Tax=Hydnum rufescens UP504 TaxID=1448309 RepID=A0A9P6DTN2_9AGAM|nr:hypothetical protein BS47DRAFT_1347563 [Hydnum rufescens UP504]
MPMPFSRSRAPNGNGTQLKSPSPHPQGQYPEAVVVPDGPYGHSVEDLTAVHRTKLGHAYVKVEEIRDIRGGRWVPHRKVVKPTDRSLFIARIRTIHEDDLDTMFCVVEFKNEILADTVRYKSHTCRTKFHLISLFA